MMKNYKIINENVTSNITKHVLVKNELNELSKKVKAISTKGLTNDFTDECNILNGAKYSILGMFQNYFAFIPDEKYIRYFNSTNQIYLWKSNGISKESIQNITKPNSLFGPTFVNHYQSYY